MNPHRGVDLGVPVSQLDRLQARGQVVAHANEGGHPGVSGPSDGLLPVPGELLHGEMAVGVDEHGSQRIRRLIFAYLIFAPLAASWSGARRMILSPSVAARSMPRDSTP